MAEAVGLAASIITLVRNAPKSVSSYLQEVLALSSCLLKVQETLEIPGVAEIISADKALIPSTLIDECQKELLKIKAKLEKKSTNHGNTGSTLRSRLSSSFRSSVWPFEEKETKEIAEKFARWNGILTSTVATCNLRVANKTFVLLKSGQDETTRTKVLDWLCGDIPAIDYHDFFRSRCEGTCSWILDRKDFLKWRDGTANTFICTGGPGVGKTILSSYIINHVRNYELGHNIVMYRFFEHKSHEQINSIPGLVRQFLRQVLDFSRDIPDSIIHLYEASIEGALSSDSVWLMTLVNAIEVATKVYLVIDGFDECPDRTSLSKILQALGPTKVKIWIAGRAPIEFASRVQETSRLELRASEADLTLYAQYRLSEDEDLMAILSAQLKSEIITTVVEYAKGVFLLVKLAVDALQECHTIRQIRACLSKLPNNVSQAYESTMQRISSHSSARRDIATRTLRWMVFAKRTLTMTEILHAIALESGDVAVDVENLSTGSNVVRSCLGLIEYREADQSVHFSHTTVLEYLAGNTVLSGNAELEMAQTCLTYLTQPELAKSKCATPEDLLELLQEFPLLAYVASQWGYHASPYEERLTVELDKLVHTPDAVAVALRVFHYLRRPNISFDSVASRSLPQRYEKIHLLALWGLKRTAELQVLGNDEILAADSLGWTPLHWAAARGHADMVLFLRHHGADVSGRDLRKWTPLFWAAYWSRLEAARVLLDGGANIDAQSIDGDTPLHIAVSRRDLVICEELVRRHANWEIKNNRGRTPMEEMQQLGDPEMVTTISNSIGWARSHHGAPRPVAMAMTAIERAAANSALHGDDSFKTIFDSETKSAKREDWRRPLLPRLEQYRPYLATKDTQQLTRLGQEFAYSFELPDLMNQPDYAASVLAYAVLTSNRAMINAIVSSGVDLNKPWSRKYTQLREQQFPMLFATYVGDADMINLLIEKGADLLVRDYDGRTCLHYAAVLGHTEVVEALAKYMEFINVKDGRGQSALHTMWASLIRDRHDEDSVHIISSLDLLNIARILVRNGHDVNAQDRDGRTPLHEAVRTNKVEIARALVELGADPNSSASGNKRDQDFLDWSASPRTEYAVFATNNDTPFSYACKNRSLAVAEALQQAGAVPPASMNLRQPLQQAVADGDIVVVEALFRLAPASQVFGKEEKQLPLLLVVAIRALQWTMDTTNQHENDFREPFIRPETPLPVQEAPVIYHNIIKLLLDKDANATLADEAGSTPLLEALRYSYNDQLVQTLLAYGADPLAQTRAGLGTLHVAASSGHEPYVSSMLVCGVRVDALTSKREMPIVFAAANGHRSIVELLLGQSTGQMSSVPQYDWLLTSRLFQSICFEEEFDFSVLDSANISTSLADQQGKTLLHHAAQTGRHEAVRTLLSLKADVSAKDSRGNTPLHLAALSKLSSIEVVKLLLDHKSDVEARNFAGSTMDNWNIPKDATPLHMAAFAGSQLKVKAIVEKAKDMKVKPQGSYKVRNYIDWTSDNCGRNPLMCAVRSGDLATTRYLLENGADVNADGGGGSWGFTAVDIAKISSRGDGDDRSANDAAEMMALLQNFGGEEFSW